MKVTLNLFLFLFTLFTFVDESISLTDYQIRKLCQKEKRFSSCKKDLLEKRSNLRKGNLIEIPVIPYKK